MRYFAYIAEQSFKTGPGGERLFYTNGSWSRPYIIPDAQTEQRLFRKQLWSLRIMLGGLILAMPVLFLVFPQLVGDARYFFGFFVAFTALYWLAFRMILRSELKRLERAPAKMSLNAFYRQMADKHSTFALSLGLGTCLLFIATGAWALAAGGMPKLIAAFTVAFFGLCALAWGYALVLKHSSRPT